MGWSFSPFVAQSIGMGLILEALRRTNYDVKEFGASNTPPSMIVIRNEEDKIEILACLWYDNVLIACRDPQRAPKIFAQYRKVCSEVHLELKSWTFHGPRSMNPTSSGGGKDPSYPSYLGLEFCRLRKRDRDDPPLQLHWRIANKRLLEWEDLRENSPADSPSRGKPLAQDRIDMMWQIVDAHAVGRHVDPPQKKKMSTNRRAPH